MQQIIEKLEDKNLSVYDIHVYLQMNKKELLKQEKQMIEEAVTYGNRQEFYDGTEILGEQYYNQTFNQ